MLFKKLAALGAVVAAGISLPAMAGDLGGSCCADLEERVAELEATTARKGNRKVSVTVYGQINKGVLWVDDGNDSQWKFIDGSASGTRIGLMGSARVSANFEVGYKIELGINDQPVIPVLTDEVTVRESYWWIKGAAGQLRMGKAHTAASDVAGITVANTDVALPLMSFQPVSDALLFGINLPFRDVRRNVLRYDSPSMGGFIASASVSKGDTAFGVGFTDEDAWDVALRYAGEFGGFRVAGGVGFSQQDQNIWIAPIIPAGRDRVVSGSASAKHMASGLFVNFAAGDVTSETILGGSDYRTYHAQAGWELNVTGLGTTTLVIGHGRMDIAGASFTPQFYEAGLVQAIDAAATDIYLSGRSYDLDLGGDNILAVMGGVRVRF